MGTVLTVGSYYIHNADKYKRMIKLDRIEHYSSSSYFTHFNDVQFLVPTKDVTHTKYSGSSNDILEIVLSTNPFTELTPPVTGPKFYTKNGSLKAIDSDGNEYALNKEDVSLDRVYGRFTPCDHEWVTTIGFNSEYIDCAKCGAKKEEV